MKVMRSPKIKKVKDWIKYIRGLGKEVWKSMGGGENHLERERNLWREAERNDKKYL